VLLNNSRINHLTRNPLRIVATNQLITEAFLQKGQLGQLANKTNLFWKAMVHNRVPNTEITKSWICLYSSTMRPVVWLKLADVSEVLNTALIMKTVSNLGHFYQTTRFNIPEDSHRSEVLNTAMIITAVSTTETSANFYQTIRLYGSTSQKTVIVQRFLLPPW
jgi:hypothetical protein